jgi:hypothetical protein
MAAIDRHDINTKIIAALRADAAVVALLGASPGTRIYSQMKRSVTFPFVRMDFVPVGPLTGVMTGSGIDWARQHTVQFTAFSQSADFDPENGTSFSVCEFTLSIDSN